MDWTIIKGFRDKTKFNINKNFNNFTDVQNDWQNLSIFSALYRIKYLHFAYEKTTTLSTLMRQVAVKAHYIGSASTSLRWEASRFSIRTYMD